jgi:undecaprenyl-diphosphatase
MTILDAVVLGVVQGLTEFLPISSSGHLILAREIFGVGIGSGLAFDAVLHFATALAVVVYFKNDIIGLFKAAVDIISRREDSTSMHKLLIGIIVATIPAVFLGLLLEDMMDTVFRNGALVAGTLLIGALIIFAAERLAKADVMMIAPSVKKALAIGFFQSLALIPGMSRSGMAISGGMLMGFTREQAARFAFLLAIPLLLGAGAKKFYDLSAGEGSIDMLVLFFGALTAFAVGIAVIHYLLKFLRTHSLMVFVWYRVFLAALVLFLM